MCVIYITFIHVYTNDICVKVSEPDSNGFPTGLFLNVDHSINFLLLAMD